MSREQRLIQLPLAGIILLCLLIGVYLVSWKRSSKSEPAATIKKHSVDTHANDTLKYWTEDRMRKAKATDLPHVPHVNTPDSDKKHP